MRTYLSSILLVLLFASFALSGVIRKTQNEVLFKGTGTLIVQTTTKIEGNQSLHDSKKKFKGSGFMGNIMAKTVLRPGHTAQIVSLDNQMVTHINHNKQTFRTFPLEQIDWEEHEGSTEMEEQERSSEEESNIKIIKNELKVSETGKNKEINNFPSKEYLIIWVMVWEDTETGERGTDSLATNVWATKLTAEMKKAQQEEMDYNIKYAKKIGIDAESRYTEMLGTKWMGMFQALNQSSTTGYEEDTEKWEAELKKIKGYPVLTKGNYYFIREGKEEEPEEKEVKEEKADFRNPEKLFGNIMKKSFGKKESKKKSKKGPKPDFTYRTELLKLEPAAVPAKAFIAPKNYKENKKKQ